MFYVCYLLRLIIPLIVLSVNFCYYGYAYHRIESENDAINKKSGCIYLVGEDHTAEDDIIQKHLLKKLALNGRIILALEGELVDFNETLFALEEVKISNINSSLISLKNLFMHMLYKKFVERFGNSLNGKTMMNKEKYSSMFDSPGYMLDSSLKLISSYLHIAILKKHDSQEIAFLKSQSKVKLIDILKKSHFGQDASIMSYIGKNSFYDNFYDNMSDDYKEWYVMFKRIAMYWYNELLVSSIVTKELLIGIKNIIIEFDNLYLAIEKANSEPQLETILIKLNRIDEWVIEQIAMYLRNQIFLKKICTIYESTQDLDKPFFVIVGANHIPFLQEKLSEKGYCVEVNNRTRELLYKNEL